MKFISNLADVLYGTAHAKFREDASWMLYVMVFTMIGIMQYFFMKLYFGGHL